MIRQLQQRLSTPAGRAIAVLIVALIGLALRVYRLDAQSFWYDEGNSVRIAERSIQLIIEGAAGDIHPPLYYLVLHFWRAVVGDSEVALRLLSVACGTGLIVFTYLVGTALFRPRTGLIAAVFVAFSPFAVYYSQEARMYGMLALLALISTWSLVEQGRRGDAAREKRRRGAAFAILYVITTAAGLYTQYAYPFVMTAQGVCVLIWVATHRTSLVRNIMAYAVVNVIALALYLPWLPIAIRQITAWGVAPQMYDLGQAMLDAYRWLVVGRTLPLEQAQAALIVTLALVIIGFILSVSRRRGADRSAAVTLLILALLPFVLLFVFKLYREAYLKFLLVCVAPLMILAAHGIVTLIDGMASLSRQPSDKLETVSPARRRPLFARPTRDEMRYGSQIGAGAIAILVIGNVMLPSLNNLYYNPTYARDDYRGIARMIETGARPGDAILFSAPNQWEVFTYYHRAGAPAIPLAYRPANTDAVDAQMKPIAAQYTRLFVLYYAEQESDPSSWFERWLAEHAYKADEQWVGNIRLATYATRAPEGAKTAQQAIFGQAISLVDVAVDGGDKAAGDMVTVKLTWRALTKPAGRYKVFAHIGAADAPPVAQNDAEPVAGFHPTDTWNAGEEVTDQRAVWIKPGTPPGAYGVYVGMYDAATGQRVTVAGGRVVGDRLWLGDIIIIRAR